MNIYGVIGWPIKHSLSPAMHNAAFKELGIDAEYKLFEVRPEELEDFILNRKDVAGFNITIPHKVRALHLFLEDITVSHTHNKLYLLADAINTVKRDGDNIECTNTDIDGFREALISDLKFNPSDKCVFIFGCGGAGRAVIASLLQDGMNVRKIYSYDIDRSIIEEAKKHFFKEEFVGIVRHRLEFVSQEQIAENIKMSELLVNASPIGMKEIDGSVVDKSLLHRKLYVYDLVYNRKTQLIKDAELLGLRCKDGLCMLLYQGAKSFEFWFPCRKAPIDTMRKALSSAIKN